MQRSEAMPACNSYVVVPFRPGTFAARRTRMPCTRLAAVPLPCCHNKPDCWLMDANTIELRAVAQRRL